MISHSEKLKKLIEDKDKKIKKRQANKLKDLKEKYDNFKSLNENRRQKLIMREQELDFR